MLREITVHLSEGDRISDTLKFNKLFKEYTFTKLQYDRGLYGSAVGQPQLANYRLHCRLLYADLKALDPVRTLKEVPPLKIHA